MSTGIAIALFVAVAAVDWWSRWTKDDRLERWSKPLATVLAMVVAIVAGHAADAEAQIVLITVVALVLCLAGDVALMPVVDSFIAGLTAFLFGHIMFIVALAMMGLDAPWLAGVAAVVIGPPVAVIGRQVIAGAKAQAPALGPPVVAYLLVISSMGLVAWATGNVAAVVGATLFVVSDSILGWRTFVRDKRWMAVSIMVTYHAALLGLAVAPAVAA